MPTLFLSFINDLMSLTAKPIHNFADDSNIFFKKAPELFRGSNKKRKMNDALSTGLFDWGRAIRLDFNPSKTQSCLKIHRRMDDLNSFSMDGLVTSITAAASLNVLDIKIQSVLRDPNMYLMCLRERSCVLVS